MLLLLACEAMINMKAMILAAGEGTRLRPLTLTLPKALLPIGRNPLIEHQLYWLKSHGIQEVIINLHHFGERIKNLLGDGSHFGMKICYSPEKSPLGTAGGVRNASHCFDSTFVVVYGDVLTNFDLSAMVKFHQQKNAMATLAIFEPQNACAVGIVELNEDRRILSFVEKPQSPIASLANGGIYVLEREVLSYIPEQAFSDFAYDVFPKLIQLCLPLYGYVLKPNDYLIDIGTPDKYCEAQEVWKGVPGPKLLSQSGLGRKTRNTGR
jgi:NDP-sugar pyrophosphorylase family protein